MKPQAIEESHWEFIQECWSTPRPSSTKLMEYIQSQCSSNPQRLSTSTSPTTSFRPTVTSPFHTLSPISPASSVPEQIEFPKTASLYSQRQSTSSSESSSIKPLEPEPIFLPLRPLTAPPSHARYRFDSWVELTPRFAKSEPALSRTLIRRRPSSIWLPASGLNSSPFQLRGEYCIGFASAMS